jgi:hypothetical protein
MKNISKILIAIAAGLIVLLIILKVKPILAFKLAAQRALKIYPRDVVENMERIFRLETAHFTSGQFKGTYSPGMEKFYDKYPYGWNTIAKIIWNVAPKYKPIGLQTFTENRTGIKKTFIKFPSVEASVMTVCAFLQYFNNNPGRWFSLDKNKQDKYNESINKINPEISNELV